MPELKNSSLIADDEADLCRKWTKLFRKYGFRFEFVNSYVDLEDKMRHILIEVKYDDYKRGMFQILYAIVKFDKKDTQYIGLADRTWLLLYKCPENTLLVDFVMKEVGEVLNKPPSEWSDDKEKIRRAAEFLKNEMVFRKTWNEIKVDGITLDDLKCSKMWLNENNIIPVYELFNKYGIDMSEFISALSGINDIMDIKVYRNYLVVSCDDRSIEISIKNGPVDVFDKSFIEKLRIEDVGALERLRHKLDSLRKNRPDSGAYYTEVELSKKVGNRVIELVEPDWVGEPTAGAGSLLIPFVESGIIGWANDYAKEAYEPLRGEFEKYGFVITNQDIVDMQIAEIIKIVGDSARPLFITNPPFSSSSGKASKDKIRYGDKIYDYIKNGCRYRGNLGDIYGRGNQIYPIIGKIIEVIKRLGRGYLAFFSPFGIFCERKAHLKFLNTLLSNFEFIEGYVFSGLHFNDVSKDKPIAFTIWKFGGETDLETVKFNLEDDSKVGFRRGLLLKDGWMYNNNVVYNGDIVVPRNDYFSCPQKKILGNSIKNGSELSSKNVKLDLNIANIPSELMYGLWSIVVGNRAIVKHPLHFDNAYVHMPDFSRKETLEILAYTLLYVFIEKDYTGKRLIGFYGPRKILRFGKGKRLNDGARYLFRTYGHLPVGDKAISDIMDELKRGNKDKSWKKLIREEISKRLDIIGYWDYIPLPFK